VSCSRFGRVCHASAVRFQEKVQSSPEKFSSNEIVSPKRNRNGFFCFENPPRVLVTSRQHLVGTGTSRYLRPLGPGVFLAKLNIGAFAGPRIFVFLRIAFVIHVSNTSERRESGLTCHVVTHAAACLVLCRVLGDIIKKERFRCGVDSVIFVVVMNRPLTTPLQVVFRVHNKLEPFVGMAVSPVLPLIVGIAVSLPFTFAVRNTIFISNLGCYRHDFLALQLFHGSLLQNVPFWCCENNPFVLFF